MPLRDHFHPPVSDVLGWTSLHGAWATYTAAAINRQLPRGFVARPLAAFGIEIDVATFDIQRNGSHHPGSPEPDWAMEPTQTLTRRSTLTDEVGVRIYATQPRQMLVGSIEIVSPSNKDRDERQRAFLTKCTNVLNSGAGLIVLDIVTSRHFNLHRALLERWAGPQDPPFADDLYAAAYRPILPEDATPVLSVWTAPLTLGQVLPTLPLWVLGLGPVGIDFEATYELTLRELRYDTE